MPRLFTGLEIPPGLASELALMRGGLTGARWIDAADYHLTLRFIGDIDAPTADAVDEVMAGIRREAFTVVLEGLSYFGGDKPRAIVAKAQATPELVELQAEQERRLRRIGIPPEPRRFVPHVTLARMRNASQTAVAHYLGTRGFLTRRFAVDGFMLYSARDSVGGGPYVIEAAYPLGQAASVGARDEGRGVPRRDHSKW